MYKVWLASFLVLLVVVQTIPDIGHGRFAIQEDGCTITDSLEQSATTNVEPHLHVDSCPTNNAMATLASGIGVSILLIAMFVTIPQNIASELSFPPATPPPRPV